MGLWKCGEDLPFTPRDVGSRGLMGLDSDCETITLTRALCLGLNSFGLGFPGFGSDSNTNCRSNIRQQLIFLCLVPTPMNET